MVTALPLYHIFALMVNFITYYLGRRRELAGPQPARHGQLRRDPAAGALHRLHRSEHALRRAAHAPEDRRGRLLRLRVAIGGGAAVLPTTSEKWKALTGKDILEGYGLSETSPILTLNPMTMAGFSATVGLPFPSTDIKLLDDDDKEVGDRRARRDLRQGPAGDAGLLAEAGGQRRRLHRRRLLPHRRHRRVRRQGLPQDRRPQEGHDHRLGLQRLSRTRSRRSPPPAPGSPNAPASACRTRRPARRCGCSWSRRRARRSPKRT